MTIFGRAPVGLLCHGERNERTSKRHCNDDSRHPRNYGNGNADVKVLNGTKDKETD